MDISSDSYRKAFQNYLRKGISIELQLKAAVVAAHPTPTYVWRTREDDKVRPSHAANDGVIFAWDTPPATGHPGDDYGCRCTAEPYYGNLPAGTRLRRPDADLPIESVYPELFLPILRIPRIIGGLLRNINDVNAGTLPTRQAQNLERFDKKLPKDAGEIQISRGENGQRIFRSDVPAKNIPGSFARYEKVVDRGGNTVSYIKTTYAPNGQIVHIKIK